MKLHSIMILAVVRKFSELCMLTNSLFTIIIMSYR